MASLDLVRGGGGSILMTPKNVAMWSKHKLVCNVNQIQFNMSLVLFVGRFSPLILCSPTRQILLLFHNFRSNEIWWRWVYVYDFATVFGSIKHLHSSKMKQSQHNKQRQNTHKKIINLWWLLTRRTQNMRLETDLCQHSLMSQKRRKFIRKKKQEKLYQKEGKSSNISVSNDTG